MKFINSTVTYVLVVGAWLLLGGLLRRRQKRKQLL